ncbi:acyl-CoA thioesterase [Acidobacteriota bacterium]
MKVFKTRTRVRYAETDAAGIVYYNNFFVYFELGRIELFREIGLPYDYHLPIAETYSSFKSPAFFDDLLEIHSRIAELRSKGFRIGAQVFKVKDNGTLVLLAEGYTSMVYVGEDRVPVEFPSDFRSAMEANLCPGRQ